ncbi:glycosyltransferase [Robertkochia solimangrovi]|uniref:glycosyltransferase n=1 Tax=Robertkochia solimangrovi TaxID=2213046 RepID=UPI00117D5DC3|nr:glycosyltransferase [Robertkochia solimangrovi]TRZ44976.1 glycosyltransferase family 2 protein [Robertkochia solimangrovi]
MVNVSVILPNYNHEKFLERRIHTILNQTYQDFELIVLDDCSKDDSVQILKKYSNHPKVTHIVLNEKNSGSTFIQWKKGIDLAQGKFIWIAESDDEASPHFLEKLVPVLDRDNSLGLVYSQSLVIDENSEILYNKIEWTNDLSEIHWKEDFKNSGKDECLNYLCFKNTIPNASAVIFRKKAIINSPLPVEMKMTGDWYFWVSILGNTNLAFIAEPLNFFRETQTSTRVHNTIKKRIRRLEEGLLVSLLIVKLYNPKNDAFIAEVKRNLLSYFELCGYKVFLTKPLFWNMFFSKYNYVLLDTLYQYSSQRKLK